MIKYCPYCRHDVLIHKEFHIICNRCHRMFKVVDFGKERKATQKEINDYIFLCKYGNVYVDDKI